MSKEEYEKEFQIKESFFLFEEFASNVGLYGDKRRIAWSQWKSLVKPNLYFATSRRKHYAKQRNSKKNT